MGVGKIGGEVGMEGEVWYCWAADIDAEDGLGGGGAEEGKEEEEEEEDGARRGHGRYGES